MARIYVLKNDTGETVEFTPTKAKANASQAWWRERDSVVDIKPVDYEPTRAGIADLLNRYGVNV